MVLSEEASHCMLEDVFSRCMLQADRCFEVHRLVSDWKAQGLSWFPGDMEEAELVQLGEAMSSIIQGVFRSLDLQLEQVIDSLVEENGILVDVPIKTVILKNFSRWKQQLFKTSVGPPKLEDFGKQDSF